MKTSLAMLATIALTFGAMLSFTSGVSAHDYGNFSGKSPGAYHPVPITLPPGPPQAHIAVRCEMYTSRPLPGTLAGPH